MDFITHSLVGAGAARLLTKEPRQLPQLTFAAMAGALLIDADPWLYLIRPDYYGRYHRVVSHSIVGMISVTLACAFLSWILFTFAARGGFQGKPLRFGWFASPNLPPQMAIPRVPFAALLMAAGAGVALHWCYDVITGFGNMEPFWPWSSYDASLHTVSSFDAVIFSTTLGWHLLIRQLNWPRKREAYLSGVYFTLLALYILARMVLIQHGVLARSII